MLDSQQSPGLGLPHGRRPTGRRPVPVPSDGIDRGPWVASKCENHIRRQRQLDNLSCAQLGEFRMYVALVRLRSLNSGYVETRFIHMNGKMLSSSNVQYNCTTALLPRYPATRNWDPRVPHHWAVAQSRVRHWLALVMAVAALIRLILGLFNVQLLRMSFESDNNPYNLVRVSLNLVRTLVNRGHTLTYNRSGIHHAAFPCS